MIGTNGESKVEQPKQPPGYPESFKMAITTGALIGAIFYFGGWPGAIVLIAIVLVVRLPHKAVTASLLQSLLDAIKSFKT